MGPVTQFFMHRRNLHPPSEAKDPGSPAAPRRDRATRSAHHVLLFGGGKKQKRALGWLAAGVVLGVVAVVFLILHTDLEWVMITDVLHRLDPLAMLPLMAILPIFGFPISVVYLFAGLRFGPVWGGVVVAGVTAVHLVGTYVVGRSFLRKPLERYIERRHAKLPQVPDDEQAPVAVIGGLVPGLPYFVRNYILVLAGLRLRIFFWVCLPIYVARSYVTILLGDMGSDPTRNKLIFLVVVDVLKVAICALVIWRLRVHHRKYHGHPEPEAAPDAPAPAGAGEK